MSGKDAEEMVTFRLAPRDRAAIQQLIDAGEFRNRSDFLRYAVKATLATYGEKPGPDKAARPKLDLELEGVDLPQHAPARGKPRARTNKGVNL